MAQARRLKELEKENNRLKKAVANLTMDKLILPGDCSGKVACPKRRLFYITNAMQRYGVSERHACSALGVHRLTIRRPLKRGDDEEALTEDIIRLAQKYGRYGYRRITALLQAESLRVNHKRVERIWREKSLKVPSKQPKRKRLYLNDGSCIRLRPLYPNHVWSYDFVSDRLSNGKRIRMLTVIDEYTRECLTIRVDYQLKSDDVLDVLSTLFLTKGLPDYIRRDNVLYKEEVGLSSQ